MAAEALVVVEASVVVEVATLLVELAMLMVEEAVGVPLAGRLDRAVSAVSTADNPVTFVHIEGGAMTPGTKFTVAHLRMSAAHL